MAQVVEHLDSKHKALSSNPGTSKKRSMRCKKTKQLNKIRKHM
jgi:hypothetical protein